MDIPVSRTPSDWDERYAVNEYVYGTLPNSYLKHQLSTLPPGRILLPADGEGRNAVFAASCGWASDAFDQSSEGRRKAMQLAERQGVLINFQVLSLEEWEPFPGSYDCVSLIYVQLPEGLRKQVHQKAVTALKHGGMMIFEAFSVKQLQRKSGGPKLAGLLYTVEQIAADFKNLKILELLETEVLHDEGALHQGPAVVIRMTATKLVSV